MRKRSAAAPAAVIARWERCISQLPVDVRYRACHARAQDAVPRPPLSCRAQGSSQMQRSALSFGPL
eukprot:4579351-Pyramimonas_sp.AAC.1